MTSMDWLRGKRASRACGIKALATIQVGIRSLPYLPGCRKRFPISDFHCDPIQHFHHPRFFPGKPRLSVDTLSIDKSAPMSLRRPATVAELCDIVKQARAAKQGVYPVGGLTTLDVGLPTLKPGVAVDMTAMNLVIDYPARDMTITVQSGITIAGLQAVLAKEGQWLPIDVATPELATLGGAIALNQSGPRRYGYGTLRDYVIGISFVTDDGVEVKAGGRVVKNVAGYDMMKLQIGAVGTLGVVTQVTLKVKPKPETSAAVVFGCDAASIGAVLDVVHNSKSRPVAVELLNAAAWRAGGVNPLVASEWILAVGFEEKAATVAWQQASLLDELKAVQARGVTEVASATGLWAAITGLQLRHDSRYIRKLSVLPSKVAEEVVKLPAGLVHAHALSGVIWVHGESSVEGALIRRCPTEAKKSLPVWGKPTPDWELMRHVKKTLDPDNVFNPGRLFGNV
ncbi:MAG: dehydrogenase [Planctomycetaceae bacterium]|nr:dehydrogenase [Planctomycetaceae bacterium]